MRSIPWAKERTIRSTTGEMSSNGGNRSNDGANDGERANKTVLYRHQEGWSEVN